MYCLVLVILLLLLLSFLLCYRCLLRTLVFFSIVSARICCIVPSHVSLYARVIFFIPFFVNPVNLFKILCPIYKFIFINGWINYFRNILNIKKYCNLTFSFFFFKKKRIKISFNTWNWRSRSKFCIWMVKSIFQYCVRKVSCNMYTRQD